MKKLALILVTLGLATMQLSHAESTQVNGNKNNIAQQQAVTDDPFDNDPFFGSHESMLKEMEKLQLTGYLKLYLYNFRFIDLWRVSYSNKGLIFSIISKIFYNKEN